MERRRLVQVVLLALAFSAGTAFGPNVVRSASAILSTRIVNTAADPVPVTGTLEALPALPGTQFSWTSVSESTDRVSGPDPAGTRYFISSVTLSNSNADARLLELNAHAADNGCAGETTGGYIVVRVAVPGLSTVTVPFSQPFITPDLGADTTCLEISFPPGVEGTIVGSRR